MLRVASREHGTQTPRLWDSVDGIPLDLYFYGFSMEFRTSGERPLR